MKTKSVKNIIRPLTALSFVIPFLIILLSACLGGFAPFGTKDVLTASGNASFISRISDFTGLVGSNLSVVINLVYIILCSISGMLFFIYLLHCGSNDDPSKSQDESSNSQDDSSKNTAEVLKSSDLLKVFISAIYSISIHMTGIGMNITFLPAVALFPLVMMGFCRIEGSAKPLLYIISMSLSIALSFETAVVSLIFSIIYLIIPEYKNIRHFFVTFITKLISDILIIGITSPVWCNILNNDIRSGSRSLFFPNYKFYIEPMFILDTLISKAPVISFITVLVIVLVLLNKHISIWQKLRSICLTAVLVLATLLSTPAYLLSGFSNEYSEKKIFLFTFVFFILVLAYDSLKHIKLAKSLLFSGLSLLAAIISFAITFSNLGKTSKEYTVTTPYKIDCCIKNIRSIDNNSKVLIYDSETNKSNPVTNALLGYNYVITTDRFDKPDSNLILDDALSSTDGSVSVYHNPDVVNVSMDIILPYLEEKQISPSEIEDLSFSDLNSIASKISGCGDIFVETESYCRVTQNINDPTNLDSATLYFSFDDPGDYYVSMSHVMHLGDLTPDQEAMVIYNASPITLQDEKINRKAVFFDKNEFDRFISALNSSYVNSSSSDNLCSASDAADTSGSYMIIFFINLITADVLLIIFRKKEFSINGKPNRFEAFISDNKVYFYTIMLAILTWLIFITMAHTVPFGDSSAIISDGLIEDYPTYTHLIDNIRNFRFSKVDYTLGYMRGGVSLLSLLYFLNPLRLVLLFFPIEYSLLGYNTLYGLIFICTGPSILFYLTHRPHGGRMDKHELKLIPIAMAYTLSSYVLNYMHFNGFLDIVLFLPIIMYSMERMVYEKKFALYSAVLGIYMIINNYFAFLLCEFLILYFLTLDHGSLKGFIRNGIRFALSSILSAGIACFSLAGFYTAVMNGGYTESDSAALGTINPLTQNIIGSLKEFEVKHNVNLVSSDWTIANTYSGLLCLLSVSLFLFIRKIPISVRIRRVLLILLLYLSYGNELLNFIFHGFHIQSLVPNRFAIFFIFTSIIILYDVIINYKDLYSSKQLLAFTLFSCIILIGILANHSFVIKACTWTTVFVLIYLSVFFLGHTKKKYYKATVFLLLAMSAELIFSTYETFRYYSVPMRNDMISSAEILSAKQLSQKYNLISESMDRTEIINTFNLNTASLIDIYSTSLFSSTVQKEQSMLSETWNTSYSVNSLSYNYGNPISNIMINVNHFMISKRSTEDNIPSYYKLLERDGTMGLYEDPYAVHFAAAFPKDFIFRNPRDYDNLFDYQNDLSIQLIGKPLYIPANEDINIRFKELSSENDFSGTEDNDIDSPENSEIDALDPDKKSIVIITVPEGITGNYYISSDRSIRFLGYAAGDIEYSFGSDTKASGPDQIYIASLDIDALAELSAYLKDYSDSISADHTVNDNIIRYNYSSADDIQLYVPVPPYKGWKVIINGEETMYDPDKSNIGGLLLSLPKGNNEVTLIYDASDNILDLIGYIVTIISIIILISIGIRKHRLKPKKSAGR